jgi:hypothetical protein
MEAKVMPNRDVHNKYAKKVLPRMRLEDIDDVNRIMDAPSQRYGSQHRKYYGHNPDPLAKDSLEINKGSIAREAARRVHLLLDNNKNLQKVIKLLEMDKK